MRRVVPLDQYFWGDRRDVLRGSLCRGEDHVALSKRERREGRDRKGPPRAVLTQIEEIAKDAGSRLVRQRQHDGIALGAMTRVDELDEIFAPQGAMTALVERDEAPPLELRGDARPEAGVRREAVKSERAAGVAGPFHVMQARAITLEPALARRQRSPSAARSFTSSPGSSAESESTPKCARRRITSRSSGSGMPYACTRRPSACAAAQSSRETQYHRRRTATIPGTVRAIAKGSTRFGPV